MTAELWGDHSDLLRPALQAGAVSPGAGSVTDAGRAWATAPASGTERAPSKRSPPGVQGAGRTPRPKAHHRATDEQVRKPRNATQLATLPSQCAPRPTPPIAKAPQPRGAKRTRSEHGFGRGPPARSLSEHRRPCPAAPCGGQPHTTRHPKMSSAWSDCALETRCGWAIESWCRSRMRRCCAAPCTRAAWFRSVWLRRRTVVAGGRHIEPRDPDGTTPCSCPNGARSQRPALRGLPELQSRRSALRAGAARTGVARGEGSGAADSALGVPVGRGGQVGVRHWPPLSRVASDRACGGISQLERNLLTPARSWRRRSTSVPPWALLRPDPGSGSQALLRSTSDVGPSSALCTKWCAKTSTPCTRPLRMAAPRHHCLSSCVANSSSTSTVVCSAEVSPCSRARAAKSAAW